jgi:hypothetical protein
LGDLNALGCLLDLARSLGLDFLDPFYCWDWVRFKGLRDLFGVGGLNWVIVGLSMFDLNLSLVFGEFDWFSLI